MKLSKSHALVCLGWTTLFATLTLSACTSSDGQTAAPPQAVREVASDTGFAELIERLSEPGGYFDTDNLISNETSYLHAVSNLESVGVEGGAYIGVGPGQNFSYIAKIRPEVAFIIDIRRDNLLEHLMFKALFALARNRVKFLALWLGRPVPDDHRDWNARTIDELVAYILRSQPIDSGGLVSLQNRVEAEILTYGVDLDEDDLATIRRFHATFIADGLALRFASHGRSPQPDYPTLERLLLETDLEGDRANYLAREDDYQYLKTLESSDLIIPVVGDLAGPHAVRAIGDYVRELNLVVSAYYTSNVEFYLFGDRTFGAFADNALALPRDDRSVIIRSYFGRRARHPDQLPGYNSTQLVQPIAEFAEDQRADPYRSYYDLALRGALERR